jgi:hypothetical protein
MLEFCPRVAPGNIGEFRIGAATATISPTSSIATSAKLEGVGVHVDVLRSIPCEADPD